MDIDSDQYDDSVYKHATTIVTGSVITKEKSNHENVIMMKDDDTDDVSTTSPMEIMAKDDLPTSICNNASDVINGNMSSTGNASQSDGRSKQIKPIDKNVVHRICSGQVKLYVIIIMLFFIVE